MSPYFPIYYFHFIYLVTSCVLCSVPDQLKMLQEMKRVLKIDGKIVMLEHMLSDNKILAFLENFHNPITKFLMGVNIDRPTIKNIQKYTRNQNISFNIFFNKIIQCHKEK